VTRAGAGVDQKDLRLAPDDDNIVDEPELVLGLPCRLQGGLPLGGGCVGRNQEGGR
jgi:hypothetical protein